MAIKKWTDSDLKDAFNAARQFGADFSDDDGFKYKTAKHYLETKKKDDKHMKNVDKLLSEEGKAQIKINKLKRKLKL